MSAAASAPSGVILFDKPAGITSHDAVARTRRRLGRGTKVGHAGTLDPFATGLLLVLIGRATRVQRFLMALPKSYLVVARFGAVSSTGDPEGEIIETGSVPEGDLELPVGLVRQRPPAYSAIKIGGRRAYALARVGEEVELPEREVVVHSFAELWRDGDRRGFKVECSSGTYVRSLIMALGDAYCLELRRTRIGSFDVDSADPERVVGLQAALDFLPSAWLTGQDARRAAHGVAVPSSAAAPGEGHRAHAGQPAGSESVSGSCSPPRAVLLLDNEGVIAIAEPAGEGTLKPIVGFRG